jgi:hypothetical protein
MFGCNRRRSGVERVRSVVVEGAMRLGVCGQSGADTELRSSNKVKRASGKNRFDRCGGKFLSMLHKPAMKFLQCSTGSFGSIGVADMRWNELVVDVYAGYGKDSLHAA